MDGMLFLTSRSDVSQREARIVEERDSIWLYLTVPGGQAVDTDVWLLNTPLAPAEPTQEPYRSEQGPPPLPARLLRRGGVRAIPDGPRWRVQWSVEGDAVAALLDDVVVGFVAAGNARGIARYVLAGGTPWGLPWDSRAFEALFK